ncbi:MFS transporter [Marinobacterium sediminicola]|uniref:Predicted arabinose efflux permease, MFS family n=1 Tax=Marinobacterium sediminicola TaxID=518898 RepID=A0ABY1S3L5_9GAMM|nr:MFS transporter [Marinobacterium sediminicola]ULG69862.1 MFS transporter [Marinobacterium sediminicola]SMR77858.1 Predicted arabinose efflux permease, MFS family [Marinobacterium sediminicola]
MPLIVRLLIPFALGYWLSYVFRVINAVVAPAIMSDLGLDSATLGFISSAYFLTFAACQIPLGILLDRYQTRHVAATLLLFAAAGSLTFALAEDSLGLWIGRGLIGIGVSACLMAAFKSYTTWLKAEQLPLINGLQLTSGGLGALTATAPVEWALQYSDWRTLFIVLAGISLLIALLISRWIPLTESQHKPASMLIQLRQTLTVIRSPTFYQLAPASMLSQSVFIATQSLWAGIWLQQVNLLPPAEAAQTLLVSAASMVAGFLGLGVIASRMNRIGISTQSVSFIGMSGFLLALLWIQLHPTQVDTLAWVAFGFFGTSGTLMFAGLAQQFPTEISARVSTSLNLGIFLGAFIVQWGMGAIIACWPSTNGVDYPAEAYRAALGSATLLQALSLCWYLACRLKGFQASKAEIT